MSMYVNVSRSQWRVIEDTNVTRAMSILRCARSLTVTDWQFYKALLLKFKQLVHNIPLILFYIYHYPDDSRVIRNYYVYRISIVRIL